MVADLRWRRVGACYRLTTKAFPGEVRLTSKGSEVLRGVFRCFDTIKQIDRKLVVRGSGSTEDAVWHRGGATSG